MTADKFVEAIRIAVLEGAVDSTCSNLSLPPGRIPPAELLELSQWFKSLSPHDRDMVKESIRLAASHAVLAFLCVMDGARAIESDHDRGHLELFYVSGESKRLLNDPDAAPLNERLHP